jgi:hypothetical protein
MGGFLHISKLGESSGIALPDVPAADVLGDNSRLKVVGHKARVLIALSPDGVPTAMHRLITAGLIREAVRNGGRAWVSIGLMSMSPTARR